MRSATSRGLSTRHSRRITSALFGRIGGGLVDRDLIEGQLVLAAAGQLAIVDDGVAEPALGQRLEPMRIASGIERIGHQLRVVVVAQR